MSCEYTINFQERCYDEMLSWLEHQRATNSKFSIEEDSKLEHDIINAYIDLRMEGHPSVSF
jgi:hypothetical protein